MPRKRRRETLPRGHPAPAGAEAAALQQGLGLHRAGLLGEAETAYRQVLRRNPDHFDVLILLAFVCFQRADYGAALREVDRALKLKPGNAAAHFNRGLALQKLDRPAEAIASYDRAVALKEDYAEAFYNRAYILHELKRFDEALAGYDRAVALKPGYAEALNNRGNTLAKLRRFGEAVASYDRAIAVAPGYVDAFVNRGVALQKLDRLEEAVASYARAIALAPNHAEAFANRGFALKGLKRLDEALASYDRAIALAPDFGDARNQRALCRLLVGRYRDGFADYEWRWSVTEVMGYRPGFADWQGDELDGRSVLVFSEQGVGDIIHFVRYLGLLKRLPGRITFLARGHLVRLLRPVLGGIEVLTAIDPGRTFDLQCALMSLPLRLGADFAPMPSPVPYLWAEDDLVPRWRTRIGSHGFKIGICWQCNPHGPEAEHRSVPLLAFAPLAKIADVRLISLQKFDGLDQLAAIANAMTVETLGDDFDAGPDALVDCAAVMGCLDLIVTCDTAIAHLAGALGLPVWLALRQVPDWRWLLEGRDSAWYPSMRLFRQNARGAWQEVFEDIAGELRALVASRRIV